MQSNQIIIYETENGETAIDVKLENETIWLTQLVQNLHKFKLTQALMGNLFQKDQSIISKHISNIFKEEEPAKKAICKNAYCNSDKPLIAFSLNVIMN